MLICCLCLLAVIDGTVSSYLRPDSCTQVMEPVYSMNVDEGTSKPTSFSMRSLTDDSLHPDFTLPLSFKPVRCML